MGNKRETGVIATLRNWHLYPHPDDDASNVETSLQMISRNPTVVRKSIIVYCAWREYCIGVLDGAPSRRQVSLSYFDDVDMAVIQSPHRLRLLFQAFLGAPDDTTDDYPNTRLKMKALAESVLNANPYISSVVALLDRSGNLVLQVTLLDAPHAESPTKAQRRSRKRQRLTSSNKGRSGRSFSTHCGRLNRTKR